jgi:hypothetical protein
MTEIELLIQELVEETSANYEFFERYGAHHTRYVISKGADEKNVGGNPKVRGNEGDFKRGLANSKETSWAASVANKLLEEGLPGEEPITGLTLDEEIAVAAMAGDKVVCATKEIGEQFMPRTLTGIRLSVAERAEVVGRACVWLHNKDVEIQLAFLKCMPMDFIREYMITKVPGFMEVVNPIREN